MQRVRNSHLVQRAGICLTRPWVEELTASMVVSVKGRHHSLNARDSVYAGLPTLLPTGSGLLFLRRENGFGEKGGSRPTLDLVTAGE